MAELMDPIDGIMLTAELLGNPMHFGVAMLLTPPPDAGPDFVEELYRSAVTPGLRVRPSLARRPRRGVSTGGLWSWEDVEDLDPADHVDLLALEEGAGLEDLWELVGRLHAEPLPHDRPLWRAVLVQGLPDGRIGFYMKVHHAVVDGIAGIRMLRDGTSADPDARDLPPFYASREPADASSTAEEGRAGLVPNPLAWARATLDAAGSLVSTGVKLAQGPVTSAARALTDDIGTLPFGAPRTRLNGPLGPVRVFAAASFSKERIQAVRQAAGVSGNDVVTAMVAGALRSWLAGHDELPDRSLVAICPVSARHADEAGAAAGNAIGTALCRLGTDLDDPAERLDLIHRSMTAAKHDVARLGSLPSIVMAAPSILPTILLPMLPFDPHVPPGYNLPVSNVPGPRETRYWNGARIDGVYPVSVVYDGMALNVTVCSYADEVCFGYVADGEAVPDVAALADLTEQALSALETAVGVDG